MSISYLLFYHINVSQLIIMFKLIIARKDFCCGYFGHFTSF